MESHSFWDLVKNFLYNPWVIGVGSGALSGLLTTWMSRFIFSRKEDKEYLQKIGSANTEVLYSLRPLIPEATFPSASIVESVISATAIKYRIEKGNMKTPMQFFDELMKEVMDSHFISSKKKVDYCKHLNELKVEASVLAQPEVYSRDLEPSAIIDKQRAYNTVSILAGFMVAIITTALMLGDIMNRPSTLQSLNSVLLPIGSAIIASLSFVTLSRLKRMKSRLSERIQSESMHGHNGEISPRS